MEIVKRNWKIIKNELQREWNQVSELDWKLAQGDENALVEIIQKRTKQTKNTIKNKVNEIFKVNSSYQTENNFDKESRFQNKPYFKGDFKLNQIER